MNQKEYNQIQEILNTETFAVRPKLLKYMEGVQVVGEKDVEEAINAITLEASYLIDGAGTTEEVEKVARKVITELIKSL